MKASLSAALLIVPRKKEVAAANMILAPDKITTFRS